MNCGNRKISYVFSFVVVATILLATLSHFTFDFGAARTDFSVSENNICQVEIAHKEAFEAESEDNERFRAFFNAKNLDFNWLRSNPCKNEISAKKLSESTNLQILQNIHINC